MNNRPPFLLQIFGLALIAIGVIVAGIVVIVEFVIGSSMGDLAPDFVEYLLMGGIVILSVCTAIAGKGFVDGRRFAQIILVPTCAWLIWFAGISLMSLKEVLAGGRTNGDLLYTAVIVFTYFIGSFIWWKNREHLN